MIRIYIFLLFLLSHQLHLQAQEIPSADKSRTTAEDQKMLDYYIRLLKNRPIRPITMDTLEKEDLVPSLERMVKLSGIDVSPQWGLAFISEATSILPPKITDGINSSALGSLLEETSFSSSWGYNLGLDLQYYIFPKMPLEQPFLRDSLGNFQFDKYKAPKQFWSIHSGLRYQFDYYDYNQEINMGLTKYFLHNFQHHHRLVLPLSGRWHWNVRPDKVEDIKYINTNLPKIEEQSYYWGLGMELRFLINAERRYTYADLPSNDRYINWSGANNREVPYGKNITEQLYRLQFAPFTEFGYRFRSYTEYKYPQYFSIALRYSYPFLTNLDNQAILNNQSSIIDQAIYTIGDRNVMYYQTYGEITLSFSYEFQRYKIQKKKH